METTQEGGQGWAPGAGGMAPLASGDEANVQERCEGRPGHTAMLWTDRQMDRGFTGGAGSPAERGIPGRHRVWSRGRSLLVAGPAGLKDSCREGEMGAPRQPRPRPQQRLFGGLSTPI